jgi:N-acetylglutamate synthase-like GNAT family acetyltransferase
MVAGVIALVPQIRRARQEESAMLTELTVRSKAHWGYDDSFMERARPDLEFKASKFLPDFHVYILEAEGEPLGYCSLISVDSNTVELHDLFIEPRHIGKGYGKELWNYAVNLARTMGVSRLVLTADPNAEPFYAGQGAVRIGEKPSPVDSDRRLPVMEYILTA